MEYNTTFKHAVQTVYFIVSTLYLQHIGDIPIKEQYTL